MAVTPGNCPHCWMIATRQGVETLAVDGRGLIFDHGMRRRDGEKRAFASVESGVGGLIALLSPPATASTVDRRVRAWELFVRYRDRRVGWVDCASFAVMEELGIRRFFGFDDDFVRAGFTAYR